MKFKYVFLLLSIYIMFTISTKSQTKSPAEIGKTAPHFELRSAEGKIYNIDELKGKIVVLEWINFECPFVEKHYKSGNMQKLQKEYTDKGVVWLSICSSAKDKQGYYNNDEIKKRISEYKAKMTAYLIDEEGFVGKIYSAQTTPHLFIIDKNGILVYQGAIDDIKSTDIGDIKKAKNYVKNALDELLSGKSVSISTSKSYGCSIKYKN